MKNIKIKKTVNTGNYENIIIEIDLDRPEGMDLDKFLFKAKTQLKRAFEVIFGE